MLAAVALPAAASADEVRHAIGGEVALIGSASRDDLLVPHAQSSGGLSLGVEYAGQVGPGLLDAAARVGLAAGADRVGALGVALEHGLGLRYTLPLASPGGWRIAMGPAIGADADALLNGDWDDTHAYWMGSTWLGAAGRAWRPLGSRWRLDAAAELGLLGLVSRPPEVRMNKQDPMDLGYFFVDVYRDPEPAWIGNWQLVRARLELSRTGARSFVTRAWRFGVELRLARAAEPEPAFALGLKLIAAKAWGW